MKGVKRNLLGQRFGRLLIIAPAPTKNRHTYWKCQCDCGSEVTVRTDALTRGPTVSCGCYQLDKVTKHGMWKSSEYHIWRTMLSRCENPNAHAYKEYGGREIKVCEQWHTFEGFYKDMGKRPTASHSLDRIDNDGGYCPENCRWASKKEQSRNRRDNHLLTFQGRTKCIAEWVEETGLKCSTISERLRRGWSVEETLTSPLLNDKWIRTRQNQSG